MKRSRLIAFVATLVSCLLLAPASQSLGAQVVRGSVVDSATSRPIDEFTVQLIDAAGVSVAAALAQPGGRFTLRAPAAGVYRLRVLRIGFRRTDTPAFAIGEGESVERLVAMPLVSVALTGIRVVGDQRCEDMPDGGEAIATVWDEARKAVQVVQLTGSERRLQMHVRDYSRNRSLRDDEISDEQDGERQGLSANPYVSPDAASLARDGYVQRRPDGVWYYAPDARALLSDAFVGTHCFRLQRDAVSGDSLIGIAFEPVRRRPPPDIRGVLYVDRRSAELRELRFSYTPLPAAVGERDFGGRVTFQRVPGGGWIIREWLVRGPVFEVKQHTEFSTSGLPVHGVAAASGALDSSLVGVHEGGGEVLSARTMAGATVWARSFGTVLGVLTDSVSGRGVAGAELVLRGTSHRARTDSAGAFRMDSVARGSYTLQVYVRSPALLQRALAVRMDSGVVRVALVLPVARLAAEQATRERTRLVERCTELRLARNREIDSTLAEPTALWTPRGRDSAEVRRAVRDAVVVLQAVVDTSGRIERTTLRALRGGTSAAFATARAALLSLPPEVDESVPGCPLRRVILLPYRERR
jgi:hypothetical protein